jgi:hypothetical protein
VPPASRLLSCSTEFYPGSGGDKFLWNIGLFTDYTALYPKRWLLSGIDYFTLSNRFGQSAVLLRSSIKFVFGLLVKSRLN